MPGSIKTSSPLMSMLVARRDALEQAEQQRRARDLQRLPVAEDHNGQRQEAEARHVAVEAQLAVVTA